MIFKSNVFRFGNEYYRQITGTATGTRMAPNYANLFMDNFEQSLLRDYSQKLDYHFWYGFLLVTIFPSYGWIGNKNSLDLIISFTQNYSKSKNMKSKIELEIHPSTNKVHFLDERFI